MTASPGYRGPNPEAQQREFEYAGSLIDLTLEDLRTMMPVGDADIIDSAASNGADVLEAEVDHASFSCRFNTGLYDDEVEDYIATSPAIADLITKTRSDAGHSNAERLRLLRSARAVKAAAIIEGNNEEKGNGEEPAA